MRNNIKLKKEFRMILKLYGHDVLLLHRTGHKCECYNEVTNESSKKCKVCLGLGYHFIATKIRCRNKDVIVDEALFKAAKASDPGIIIDSGRKYYIDYDVNVHEADVLIEMQWDEDGNGLYVGDGIWKINHVNRTRDMGQNNGTFKELFASDTPFQHEIRGVHINEGSIENSYEIILGG